MIQAINGLGLNNYGVNYNDPYFLNALNMQNPNYTLAMQQAQQVQQAQQLQTPQAQAQQIAGQNSPNFKGATEEIAGEKKKNNTAKWIIGTAVTLASIYAGVKCYKNGTGEGLSKIWDGAKKYWGDGCKWVKNLFGKATGKANGVVTENGIVGELLPQGVPHTNEYVNAVNDCYRGYADDIVANMQRVEQESSGLNHLNNLRKYQALFGGD